MSIDPDDLKLAQSLADRIVAAGANRVRCVVMLGSRAVGTAHASSDLDLLVVLELPLGERPWGVEENISERRRILDCIRDAPFPIDLRVRTTEQFEEARDVIGGFESLALIHGVVLYAEPYRRPAVARRSKEEVVNITVRAWLEDAMVALGRALDLENAVAISGSDPPAGKDAGHYAWKSVRAAVNALLVRHQIRSYKQEDLETVLNKVSAVEPHMGRWLRATLESRSRSAAVAHVVLAGIVQWISRDPAFEKLLARLRERLGRPQVLLNNTGSGTLPRIAF